MNTLCRGKPKLSYVKFALITKLLALSLSGIANAGNGSFENGTHNFCASVRFNATDAQLAEIRTAFQNASQILADATDGQHKFGTVRIANDSNASNSAEYWIHSGTGRAYATQGDYGVRGQHVNLYFNSNFKATQGADGDAYTIAHEHAHHSYGVLDEYSGPQGAAESAPTSAESSTLNYSLMDNYFTRGGRAFGLGYTLNEFDVASNFDPDKDTWQYHVHNQSTWETIAAHPKRSANAPASLPVDPPPASHTVTFLNATGNLKTMLLIDRSGSMSIDNRIDFAKTGAIQFINLLTSNDWAGVSSFSSSTTVNFPLTSLSNSGTKSAAITSINSLLASGSTNIGGGLQTALNELTSQPTRSCNEIVILLSDGDHNTGTAPSSVIPALQKEGITVLTIGVGSGISTSGQATLQNIAVSTGGKYYQISSASDLVRIFIQLAAESTGNGILVSAPENTIGANQSIQSPVLLENNIESVTFALTKKNTSDPMLLSLVTPSGNTIEKASSNNSNMEIIEGPNSVIYRIVKPESGTWQMKISSGNSIDGSYSLLAFADHDGVNLNLSVNNSVVKFPEVIKLTATPTFKGETVVGAEVAGNVTRPDGSLIPISFYDDGLREHGDNIPGDGHYGALFNAYNDDGTYTFNVVVKNVDGKTFSGEELFSNYAPSNEKIVPEFIRQVTSTSVVSGVPDFIAATAEIGPETINLKSKGNFVTAYIELPDSHNPATIDISTVKISAIDGVSIQSIYAESSPTKIGDFDNDGVPDLMVKFDRKALQLVLSSGMRTIRIEGFIGNQPFIGERSVGVIRP